MVRHMLFVAYTEEVRKKGAEEATEAIRKIFTEMPGNVPGLRKAEYGQNISGGKYDACLYSEFDKPEDIPAYRLHPLHKKLEKMADAWVESNAIVDYIVEEP